MNYPIYRNSRTSFQFMSSKTILSTICSHIYTTTNFDNCVCLVLEKYGKDAYILDICSSKDISEPLFKYADLRKTV